MSRRSCVFWNEDYFQWSTSGCTISIEHSTSDETVCFCTHLTNFALLFDFTGDAEDENRAIEIASYIILAISSIAIIATFLIVFKFQK